MIQDLLAYPVQLLTFFQDLVASTLAEIPYRPCRLVAACVIGGMVLEHLAVARVEVADLAGIADRARIAGLTCERSYDVLRSE